jgi:hypothetical protein
VAKWQFIEEKARAVLESFAYREVRPAPCDQRGHPRPAGSESLAQVYLAHARWRAEPVTRWYQLRTDWAQIVGACFGIAGPGGEAELLAMLMGLMAEVGIPPSAVAPRMTGAGAGLHRLIARLGLPAQKEDAGAGDRFSFSILGGGAALASGGRRDDLVVTAGGPPTAALFFDVDLAEVIRAVPEPAESFQAPLIAFFAVAGEEARGEALEMSHRLRLGGVRAEIAHQEGASIEEQVERARELGARVAVTVGSGGVVVEDLELGRKEEVEKGELEATIRRWLD